MVDNLFDNFADYKDQSIIPAHLFRVDDEEINHIFLLRSYGNHLCSCFPFLFVSPMQSPVNQTRTRDIGVLVP